MPPVASGPIIFGQVRVDAAGRVDEPLPCVSCGRDLHGCALDGACPGCGAAVADSSKSEFLRFQDPQWLDRLVLGVLILMLGAVVVLGMAAGKTVQGAWSMSAPPPELPAAYVEAEALRRAALGGEAPEPPPPLIEPGLPMTLGAGAGYAVMGPTQMPGLAWLAAAVVPAVMLAVGGWLLTTRQPLDFERESTWSPLIARAALLLMVGLTALLLVVYGLVTEWDAAAHQMRNAHRVLLDAAINGTWIIAAAALLAVTHGLLLRAPAPKVARSLLVAGGVYLALAALRQGVAVVVLKAFLVRPAGTLSDEELGGTLSLALIAASLVYLAMAAAGAWLLWVLVKVLLTFRRAAQRYA